MITLLAVTVNVPTSWLIAAVTVLLALSVLVWLAGKDGHSSGYGYGFPALGCLGFVGVVVVLLFWAGWFLRGSLA